MRLILTIAGLAVLVMPSVAAAKEVALTPSSQWHADYADKRCRLARTFGKGDDLTYLMFNRYGPSRTFQMIVAGRPIKRFFTIGGTVDVNVKFQFGPGEEVQETGVMEGTLGKLPALIFDSHIMVEKQEEDTQVYKFDDPRRDIEPPPIDPSRLAAIKTLSVMRPGGKRIELQIGRLDKALAVMENCTDNLVKSWGFDPEVQKKLSVRAKPLSDPGRWIRSGDYPKGMIFQGQQAMVQVRLNVDASGTVSACHIQESTKVNEFDDAVCKNLMKRATFSPALDEGGKPVASYWARTVRFILA